MRQQIDDGGCDGGGDNDDRDSACGGGNEDGGDDERPLEIGSFAVVGEVEVGDGDVGECWEVVGFDAEKGRSIVVPAVLDVVAEDVTGGCASIGGSQAAGAEPRRRFVRPQQLRRVAPVLKQVREDARRMAAEAVNLLEQQQQDQQQLAEGGAAPASSGAADADAVAIAAASLLRKCLLEDRRCFDAHSALADLAASRGDDAAALRHMRRAVANDDRRTEENWRATTAEGDDDGSVQRQRRRRRRREAAEARCDLAACYGAVSKYAQAADQLRLAVEICPEWLYPRFHLGRNLADRAEYDEAIGVLQGVVDDAAAGERNGGGDDDDDEGRRYGNRAQLLLARCLLTRTADAEITAIENYSGGGDGDDDDNKNDSTADMTLEGVRQVLALDEAYRPPSTMARIFAYKASALGRKRRWAEAERAVRTAREYYASSPVPQTPSPPSRAAEERIVALVEASVEERRGDEETDAAEKRGRYAKARALCYESSNGQATNVAVRLAARLAAKLEGCN